MVRCACCCACCCAPLLLPQDALLFSLEGGLAVGDVPLKAQPQNAHWMDTCFGEDVTAELQDAPISCAGAGRCAALLWAAC